MFFETQCMPTHFKLDGLQDQGYDFTMKNTSRPKL